MDQPQQPKQSQPQQPSKPFDDGLPQPQYGIPDQMNLEAMKYLTKVETFTYLDDEKTEVYDGDIPPKFKEWFWSFIGPDSVLTNIDEKDIRVIMNNFESTVESFEMSLEPGEYTWVTLRHIDNLRALVKFRLRRAYKGMERRLQATQIHQQLYGEANTREFQRPQKNWGPLGLGRIFGGHGGMR